MPATQAPPPPPDDKDLSRLMPAEQEPPKNGGGISRNQVALAVVTGFFALCTTGLTVVSGRSASDASAAKYVTVDTAQMFKAEFLKVQKQQMENVLRIAELEREVEELKTEAKKIAR